MSGFPRPSEAGDQRSPSASPQLPYQPPPRSGSQRIFDELVESADGNPDEPVRGGSYPTRAEDERRQGRRGQATRPGEVDRRQSPEKKKKNPTPKHSRHDLLGSAGSHTALNQLDIEAADLADLHAEDERDRRLDDLAQAELAQHALLGSRHPDTLKMKQNLAATLGQSGKLKEAERLLREVLEEQQALLGFAHPDTLRTKQSLAVTLGQCGQQKEAERLLRESLETQQTLLGLTHPDTHRTKLSLLAVTLGQRGQSEEADQPEDVVLKDRQTKDVLPGSSGSDIYQGTEA